MRNNATKQQRLKMLEQAAAYRLQGWTQAQIAEALGVKQPWVSKALAVLTREWHQNAAADIGEIKQRELAKLELIEAEAWREWHRSKEDAVTKVAENSTGQTGLGSKKSVKTVGQCGEPAYLKLVLGAVQERAKILGIHAPVKHSQTDPTGDEERAPAVWVVPQELSMDEWQRQVQTFTRQ